MTDSGLPAVTAQDVVKTFGDKSALRGVSFVVPRGQVCGLLGPNGAGKTTLFRLMMGLMKPTSGALAVDGLDAFADRVELKRHIGYLPDEPTFYVYLTARETLQLSAAMHGLDVAQALARIEPLAQRLLIADELDNFAEEFSRGQKKKLGLLLALLHRPSLLILDEPTNGLDVQSTHLFYDLVREIADEGVTVLFSTHLMDHVARLCSHVVVIGRGRLLAAGALADLTAAHGGKDLEELFLDLTHGLEA